MKVSLRRFPRTNSKISFNSVDGLEGKIDVNLRRFTAPNSNSFVNQDERMNAKPDVNLTCFMKVNSKIFFSCHEGVNGYIQLHNTSRPPSGSPSLVPHTIPYHTIPRLLSLI